MKAGLVTVKELAKELGMSAASVNYYTNLGLFQPAERKGNKRLYNKEEILRRFEEIKNLRAQGYSLSLIQNRARGIV